MIKVLIIIPTYNEAENITRSLAAVLAKGPHIEVLVIDDGSPDGTAQLVKSMMNGEQRLHLIERSKKMGLGTAYVIGFKFAIQNSYDFVFEMDSDFSHSPELPQKD